MNDKQGEKVGELLRCCKALYKYSSGHENTQFDSFKQVLALKGLSELSEKIEAINNALTVLEARP